MVRAKALASLALLVSACGVTPGLGGVATPFDGGAPLELSPASLGAFAKGESWKAWPAEAAPHKSAGPHGAQVRTWLSPELLASLKAGNASHPNGSAALKELFDESGARVGFAIDVKNDQGQWVFYEGFEPALDQYHFVGTTNLCANCHAAGKDFLLTEASAFP